MHAIINSYWRHKKKTNKDVAIKNVRVLKTNTYIIQCHFKSCNAPGRPDKIPLSFQKI